MKLWKQCLIVAGSIVGLLTLILLYRQFLIAYFNGMSSVMYFNLRGEANIEFILMPILLIIQVLSFVFVLKLMLKDGK